MINTIKDNPIVCSSASSDKTHSEERKNIFFIEMMGIPGSYDDSVYAHFEDKDDEGLWFKKRFGHIPGLNIETCNTCKGEPLPLSSNVDGLVLAGSYNSVHDNTDWQQRVRKWLPKMRTAKIPILAICGSHQLLAHMCGSSVAKLNSGPFAGTFPVNLTTAGKTSPIMRSIQSNDCFQYANADHVLDVPENSTLLASSSRIPVAALDYGNHCYSTQFHPEGTWETLSTVWRNSQPSLMKHYHNREKGGQLVENFLGICLEEESFRTVKSI